MKRMEEEEENQTIVEHERKKKKRKKIKTVEQETPVEEEKEEIKTKEQDIQMEKNQMNVEEVERIETKIEMVPEHPEKIAPLVGYFPSGFDPHKTIISEEDEPQVRVLRGSEKPNRLKLVVSPNGSKVDFVGASHSGESTASQVCTYALGILDKETQTLKIVPIASNKILRLEPRVGGSNSYGKELPKELKEEDTSSAKEEEDTTVSKKIDKLRILSSAYGTKRANRQDKKLANLNRTEDAKTQKLLDDKIEGVKVNQEALETTGGNPARNIPPHDSTADTPEKAYPLDRIVLKGEWDSLLDILELMQSGTDITPDAYPSFVCNRVHKLLEIKDEEERMTLACIFSYITHLVKFKDQLSAHHGSPAKKHRFPAVLHKKFLTMFADNGKFYPSVEKRNLLVSYVLVLTLIADGYRTDISDIAKDLKMTAVTLRDHYQNLGCKLKREDKLLFYTLAVPLEFPKSRMQRRRK